MLLSLAIAEYECENLIRSRMTSQDLTLYEDLCSEEPRRLEAATRQLTRRAKAIALRIVLGNSGARSDIDDLVQDSVLAVWQQMKSGRFEARPDKPLDAYLTSVVRNKWLKALQKRSTTALTDLDESLTDEVSAEHPQLHILEENFARLGKDCQDLLRLFYWDEYTLEKIASRLKATVDVVKMRKFRCMLRLGKLLRPKKQ
ncbi:RNA polymerase sigma factor [Spirosoma gilvum]